MLVKKKWVREKENLFSKESMVNCIIYGKLEVIWLETQKQFKYISSVNWIMEIFSQDCKQLNCIWFKTTTNCGMEFNLYFDVGEKLGWFFMLVLKSKMFEFIDFWWNLISSTFTRKQLQQQMFHQLCKVYSYTTSLKEIKFIPSSIFHFTLNLSLNHFCIGNFLFSWLPNNHKKCRREELLLQLKDLLLNYANKLKTLPCKILC